MKETSQEIAKIAGHVLTLGLDDINTDEDILHLLYYAKSLAGSALVQYENDNGEI